MPSLSTRVNDLYSSLEEFKAAERPSKSTAEIFDAIIALAKQELPDDPIIRVIRPSTRSSMGGVIEGAGDLRASLNQILSALDERSPAIG